MQMHEMYQFTITSFYNQGNIWFSPFGFGIKKPKVDLSSMVLVSVEMTAMI